MKSTVPRIELLGIAFFCALSIGCRSPGIESANAVEQLPPGQGRSDETQDGRLAAAIEGLRYGSGLVSVTLRHRKDRDLALRACRAAERALNVDNARVKAAGLFRDSILADPTYSHAYEGLARALLLEGDPKLIEAALRTAIGLDVTFDKARYELGVIAQMQGDYSGAVAAWRDLVARSPGYQDTYARLAIAAYFDQDADGAWRYLMEAERRRQNIPPQFRELLRLARSRP